MSRTPTEDDALRIELEESGVDFRPGDTVSGRIEWTLDRAPDALELRLFWYTSGQGDRDVGVARTLRLDDPAATGSQRFDLELPSGPYSFSGRLISLVWALEWVALPGDRGTRREIVVTPTDGEVTLGSARP